MHAISFLSLAFGMIAILLGSVIICPTLPVNANYPNTQAIRTASDQNSLHNKMSIVEEGITLAQHGDFIHALKYYGRALAIEPKNTGLLIDMGDALSRTANYTNAIKYYDEALLMGIPNNNIHSSVLINKGNDLFRLKEYKDAISSYNEALLVQPGNLIASKEKNIVVKMLGNGK